MMGFLDKIAQLDKGEPVSFREDERSEVKALFEPLFNNRIGNYETFITNMIMLGALAESQFRAWIQDDGTIHEPKGFEDRYWAFKYLFGEAFTKSVVTYCQEIGDREDWYSIGENEHSRGRGLQQAVADVLQYALDSEQWQKALNSLVRRVWAGHRKVAKGEEAKAEIDKRFIEAGYEPPSKWSLIASVPPGTLTEVFEWLFLTGEE